MMTNQKKDPSTKKADRGRLALASKEARSNRIVTFVTDRQLEALGQMAVEDSRTLSSLVQIMITQHLKHNSNNHKGEVQ